MKNPRKIIVVGKLNLSPIGWSEIMVIHFMDIWGLVLYFILDTTLKNKLFYDPTYCLCPELKFSQLLASCTWRNNNIDITDLETSQNYITFKGLQLNHKDCIFDLANFYESNFFKLLATLCLLWKKSKIRDTYSPFTTAVQLRIWIFTISQRKEKPRKFILLKKLLEVDN